MSASNKNSERKDPSHFKVEYDPFMNQNISFGHL